MSNGGGEGRAVTYNGMCAGSLKDGNGSGIV
jgi:hypothetical protein